MPLDDNVHRAESTIPFFPVHDPIDLVAAQGAFHCAY